MCPKQNFQNCIYQINDHGLDHLEHIGDAVKLLNTSGSILSLTLAKSCNTLANIGPLSSSSSGHNIVIGQDKCLDHQHDHHHQDQPQHQVINIKSLPKSLSATTSPIKDTIRGSQEMIKKLISTSKDRHSGGGLSSSSSEKVYSVNGKMTSSKDSSKKVIDTVMEKFDTFRGRRRSKEPSEAANLQMISNLSNLEHSDSQELEAAKNAAATESDKGPDVVIAELDSVINSYHSASSGTKSSGTGTNLKIIIIRKMSQKLHQFAAFSISKISKFSPRFFYPI